MEVGTVRRGLVQAGLLVALLVLATSATAGAATRQAYGQKCAEAWVGKKGTKAYRAYVPACVRAAIAATATASRAGDSYDGNPNRARGAAACNREAAFAPPRNTEAKRKGFNACVRAAIAAQKAFASRGKVLRATLTGANEVPGPGDPDGAGTARVTVNLGQRQVCFDLTVTGLTDVVAAHVHVGDATVAGDVVIPLAPLPAVGATSHGCIGDLDRALLKALIKNPSGYYVNVHSSDFTAGAIRGQLRA
jgi:hypothetical protein